MTISQREARRLRKRVEELENAEDVRRRRWGLDWPDGIEITRMKYETGDAPVATAIYTARKLRHAVVAVTDGTGLIRFVALPLAK